MKRDGPVFVVRIEYLKSSYMSSTAAKFFKKVAGWVCPLSREV
jgi:hypothetical protein